MHCLQSVAKLNKGAPTTSLFSAKGSLSIFLFCDFNRLQEACVWPPVRLTMPQCERPREEESATTLPYISVRLHAHFHSLSESFACTLFSPCRRSVEMCATPLSHCLDRLRLQSMHTAPASVTSACSRSKCRQIERKMKYPSPASD